MKGQLDVVIAGLSGDGVLMAGTVLSTALLADGKNVVVSDMPALMHRNSPTLCFLRVGEVYSSVVAEGEASLVLALELTEGLKAGLTYAKEDGLVVLNERVVKRDVQARHPSSGDSGRALIAEVCHGFQQAGISNVRVFPASDIARSEVGRHVTLNMVMLGASVATDIIPVRPATVEEMIRKFSPKGTLEINIAAFRVGFARFAEMYPVALTGAR